MENSEEIHAGNQERIFAEVPVFSVAIKKAEAECKVARIQTILKASDKSWQVAAWWLELAYNPMIEDLFVSGGGPAGI